MILFVLQGALLLLVLALAFTRGGTPEKAVALTLLAYVAIDQTWHALFGKGSFTSIHWWHFACDCVVFAILLYVALTADRKWTIVPASAQLLAVIGHLVRAVESNIHPLVYAVLNRYPFWMVLFSTMVGTLIVARRHRRAAPDISLHN